MKPFTIEAFSRIMSSLFDLFLVDAGSTSLCMCEYDATEGTAFVSLSCVTLLDRGAECVKAWDLSTIASENEPVTDVFVFGCLSSGRVSVVTLI